MSARIPIIIVFVRRFERCLKFYREVFGLRLARIYRGTGHPPWAELKLGNMRLALHGNYKGPPHRRSPVVIHFAVKNMRRTIERIKQHGGTIEVPPKRYDFRPAELLVAYEGRFADPDGNEFEVQQVLKKFSE